MKPPTPEWEDVLPLLRKLAGMQANETVGDSPTAPAAQPSPAAADAVATVGSGDAAAGDRTSAAQSTAPADSFLKSAGVGAAQLGSTCMLMWRAAIVNRNPAESQTTPDLEYLIHLTNNEELTRTLAAATVASLAHLCRAAGLTTAAAAAAAAAAVKAAPGPGAPPEIHRSREAGGSSEFDGPVSAAAKAAATARRAAAAAAVGPQQDLPRLSKADLLPSLQLLTTLATCTRAANIHAKKHQDFMAQMAGQFLLQAFLAEGGLLQVLAALCDDLSAAFKQQQQQQQQSVAAPSESVECMCLLSSAVLHLLRFACMVDRPAQIWWDSNLGPIIGSAVKRAAALQLQLGQQYVPTDTAAATAATAATVASSSGGSSAESADLYAAWLEVWKEDFPVGHETIALTSILMYAAIMGMSYKGLDPTLTAVLALPEMHQLMCVYAAARAQRMHIVAGGRSPIKQPSSKAAGSSGSGVGEQQQAAGEGGLQVPPWHQQLFDAFGLRADADLTAVFVMWSQSDVSLPVINALTAVSQMDEAHFWHALSHDTPDMDSFTGLLRVQQQLALPPQQRQQHGGHHQLDCCKWLPQQECEVAFVRGRQQRLALLRVLFETLLLQPALKVGVLALKLASQLTVKGWCYDSLQTAAAADGDNDTTAALLGPVLQYVGPAYTHLSTSADPDADITPDDLHKLLAWYAELVGVVVHADSQSGSHHLCSSLQQQLSVTSRSLESAVRAGDLWCHHSLTLDVTQLLADTLNQLLVTPAPAEPAATAAAGAAAAVLPLDCRGDVSSSSDMFALLLSGVKFMVGHEAAGNDSSSSSSVQDVMASLGVLSVCRSLSEAGSEEGGSSRVVRSRWLWLAGRALMAAGSATQQLCASTSKTTTWHRRWFGGGGAAAATSSIEVPPGLFEHYLHTLSGVLPWLADCLGVLSDEGVLDKKGAVDLQSRLRQVQQVVVGDVPAAGPDAATDDASACAATACEVLQLGRDLCNALPLPFACNNPDCSRLDGLSELTAVKGGRCSACKVAHYDCTTCQKQHWQQHRTLCKQLQAQAGLSKACVEAA